MKKQSLFFSSVFALFLLPACNKEDAPTDEPPPVPGLPRPQNAIPAFRVSSVLYKLDPEATGDYEYNSDSTLKAIVYREAQGNIGKVDYIYQQKAISQIVEAGSVYDLSFGYLQGRIHTMERRHRTSNSGYRFTFAYNTNGTVDTLKYYNRNAGTEQLTYTSVYHYDASHLPVKIVSTAYNHSVVTWTIEGYSAECDFNPWTFAYFSLNELYTYYNLPVLSQLNRLPLKITKTLKNTSGATVTDQVIKYSYTLQGKRLDKVVTTYEYPASPQAGSTHELELRY